MRLKKSVLYVLDNTMTTFRQRLAFSVLGFATWLVMVFLVFFKIEPAGGILLVAVFLWNAIVLSYIFRDRWKATHAE